ncbi:cora-domain-containing protein [Massarina eburnea CBS 473.64]|uniref:Magnesium transporter n=1 Tax=Massarina eburnea CBS 473.64 TaxID=1395130 RepID=A0A6A6RLW1_9PLEO|nr:cora-domain-containing protein [Massarina eburnea CBS 473.64]
MQSRRGLSTSSIGKAWQLFGGRKQRGLPPPLPPLKDALAETMMSFDGLGRMTRSANELKMRCTELDEHGSVTMVSGEFKKSELIAKYGLLPRDLRKIDSSILPNILIRPTAILINLLHIRALIKHNRVLVFDAYGTTDSKSQSLFMYDLDLKLRQKESPATGTLAYELRALEAVLISVTLGLEKEFEGVSDPVVRVLMELEEDIDRDKLRYLLVYSKKLGTFEQKARLVRDALSELLEADDDLSAMYLTEKAEGKLRAEDDHTEVEMLLESYHKIADEIVQSAENLVSSIRNTEEIVKAILDANRNSLMLLDLRFSVFTLAITAGTFIAALYGMNLASGIEEHDYGFGGVTIACVALGLVSCAWGMRKLRVVQTLSMWGHGTKNKSASWGLGAWGGRSMGRDRVGDGFVGAGGLGGGNLVEGGRGVRGLRAGESFGDLVKRERSVARRLAQAEARADEATKGGP